MNLCGARAGLLACAFCLVGCLSDGTVTKSSEAASSPSAAKGSPVQSTPDSPAPAVTPQPAPTGSAIEENEVHAMRSLKVLDSAQVLFCEGDKDRDGDLDFAPTLAALRKTQLIDNVLASGEKQGYRFELCRVAGAPRGTGAPGLWMAVANPIRPGETGRRSFVINHAGVIYSSEKPLQLDPKTCEIPKGSSPAAE